MAEEKWEDIFANFKKAMEELQKAMQPIIDQIRKMEETMKHLGDQLDNSSQGE